MDGVPSRDEAVTVKHAPQMSPSFDNTSKNMEIKVHKNPFRRVLSVVSPVCLACYT